MNAAAVSSISFGLFSSQLVFVAYVCEYIPLLCPRHLILIMSFIVIKSGSWV